MEHAAEAFMSVNDVLQEDIKAKFEDGILKVAIPKKETKPAIEQSKYIPIEG